MPLLCILLCALLLAGFIENAMHQHYLRSIPIRILVNGTRGKTTLTRLLVIALNDHGISTMGKTTGSEATVLFPDGTIAPLHRRLGARITEMIPFIRLAATWRVQAVVVECMALVPENQQTIARKLVRPNFVVVTNSYIDHIPEVGETFLQTVWTLSQSIPPSCTAFVTEGEYAILGPNIHVVSPQHFELPTSAVPLHDQTIALAVAVGKTLGIEQKEILQAATNIQPDIGLHDFFIASGKAKFIPSFAVNDLHCMRSAILDQARGCKHLTIIFNNRKDREYRILLLVRALQGLDTSNIDILCIGDYPRKTASYVARHAHILAKTSNYRNVIDTIESAGQQHTFLGLGNIKGCGVQTVEYFIDKEEKSACCMQPSS